MKEKMDRLEKHLSSLSESLIKILKDRKQQEIPFNTTDNNYLISELSIIDDVLEFLKGNEKPLETYAKLENVVTKNLK
jgi:hypothetical protein